MLSVVGTITIIVGSVVVSNTLVMQSLLGILPVTRRLDVMLVRGDELLTVIAVTLFALLVVLHPLFRPQERSLRTLSFSIQKRVLVAFLGLAAIGYFDYSLRVPRPLLVTNCLVLLTAFPVFNYVTRYESPRAQDKTIIVGDDFSHVTRALDTIQRPVYGCISLDTDRQSRRPDGRTDGGRSMILPPQNVDQLQDLFSNTSMDRVILTFDEPGSSLFYGTLRACHQNNVVVEIEPEHTEGVLTTHERNEDGFIEVDLKPWDRQDRIIKRLFDLAFAVPALVASLPLIAVIAAAIKLDDGGSILYTQYRTAELGGTLKIYKFRTMTESTGDSSPIDDDENSHITRVGRLLRRTHLDEIPQLWTIIVGEMSVVGPRAVWRSEEKLLQEEVKEWRKRWFAKPGLTGLAQINDASSTNPNRKLRYDLTYIQNQSFVLDSKILLVQLGQVVKDVILLLDRGGGD